MGRVKDCRYFESFHEELNSKLRRVNFISGKNRQMIGGYHEYILKSLLQNFLPNRFKVRTGFIYKDDGIVSPQVDLMIIDENYPPAYLAKFDDYVVVYPEAVCCVIEVKTNFSKEDFRDSSNKIYDTKKVLQGRESPGMPFGLVFSYDNKELEPKDVHSYYIQKDLRNSKDSFEYYPEAIYCLNSGLITKWNIGEEDWGHYWINPKNKEKREAILFGIFLSHIMKSCYLHSGSRGVNTFERFSNIEETSAAEPYFRYGEGWLN